MGKRPEQRFLQGRYTNGQQAHEEMLNITDYQRNVNQNYHKLPPHTSQNGHQITNAGEGVEKSEPSYTVGGNVNQYNHYGKQYGGTSENKIQNYRYNPAIPLLGIYPDKTFLEKDTCTCMFIAALFIIAKT